MRKLLGYEIQLIILLYFGFSSVLFGQNQKVITAYQIREGETLKLDGYVDDEVWKKAMVITDFLMQEPVEGGAPTEKTEIRIAYDADNLYISAILFDSDPDGIKGFQRKWDQSLATDDRFMWILDTYNDQRNAYFFEINPLGLMGDGLVKTGQGVSINKSWNGIWRTWVKKGPYGWSAEIRIPFRTLNFNPENETWGINFQRTIRRKNEELMWAGHQRNQGLFRPQNAGKLTGLFKPSQGVGLEVIPYAIGMRNVQSTSEGKKTSFSGNAGFDMNYSITPNLRAGVTYNTDFAETEVDNRQVNLTRFPLFFPERRAFFLEGASVFSFAPSSGPNPFFSRRIGLEGGQPIPILGGARLIGRVGKQDVGVIHMRTRESESGAPAEDFSVARVSRNIFQESSVGLIYTRRSTDGDSLVDRHTIGADMELSTSRFLGNKNLQFQAFAVYHNDALPELNESSFWDRSTRGFRINFPNQPWNAHVSYREFGESYNPAVGFAPRVGFKRLQPTITYSPLVSKSSVIRELSWQYFFEYLMDMDYSPLTVNHNITPFNMRLETGDRLQIELTHNYERLDFVFDILRNGEYVIPIGDYYNLGYNVNLSTASWRRVVANLTYSNMGFWTGRREDYSANFIVRPFIGVNLSANWIFNSVQLDGGNFDTQIYRVLSSVDLSPWLSINMNVQYDNVSKLMGMNNRLIWILNPGNNIFLVYNNNWRYFEQQGLISLESQTNFKINYTHRF